MPTGFKFCTQTPVFKYGATLGIPDMGRDYNIAQSENFTPRLNETIILVHLIGCHYKMP